MPIASIVPVKSRGTDRQTGLLTYVAVCGVVLVADIVPVVLAGAYRHYRGTTTVLSNVSTAVRNKYMPLY